MIIVVWWWWYVFDTNWCNDIIDEIIIILMRRINTNGYIIIQW